MSKQRTSITAGKNYDKSFRDLYAGPRPSILVRARTVRRVVRSDRVGTLCDADKNISVMLPKVPTVMPHSDVCRELDRRSYYAFADQAVYEFTVSAKSKIPIPKYCPVKIRFDDAAFMERVAQVRSDKNVYEETSLVKEGRSIYKFVNKLETRLIIPDMTNGRWVELAIHHREDAKTDESQFTASLDLASSSGKEIGDGTSITLGDAGVDNAARPTDKKEGDVAEPMRIIGKMRASYTDAARKANVQGSVMLKVTLLANGGIGAITTVKELPAGLTEQAIAAARKIVFIPKQLNGVPMTTIVAFDYGFSIY